jgi:hypothetical protein
MKNVFKSSSTYYSKAPPWTFPPCPHSYSNFILLTFMKHLTQNWDTSPGTAHARMHQFMTEEMLETGIIASSLLQFRALWSLSSHWTLLGQCKMDHHSMERNMVNCESSHLNSSLNPIILEVTVYENHCIFLKFGFFAYKRSGLNQIFWCCINYKNSINISYNYSRMALCSFKIEVYICLWSLIALSSSLCLVKPSQSSGQLNSFHPRGTCIKVTQQCP